MFIYSGIPSPMSSSRAGGALGTSGKAPLSELPNV